MKTIDCRNMACPLPVVTVKRALEEGGAAGVTILLDAGAPRENVRRYVTGRGYHVEEEPAGDGFRLVITGSHEETAAATRKKVLLIGSDRLGDGPEELGRLLMKNFIITLLDAADAPERILFVNTGVLLAVEGSEVAEALQRLQERGVEVFSCGICLDFFHAKEKVAAGGVTNMLSIVENVLENDVVKL